jgi:2-polyprenyl-6-methoxyphenol hydroxylase-like FAD-dependent oxidoreductase
MSTSLDTDVVIVGYGPVGQTLAALLASKGHSVAVYERFSGLYELPRAVYFDDEIMQVWQSLGIAEEIDAVPIKTYHWFGADGETIFRLQHPEAGPSGWDPGYCFYQPSLERALDRTVRALPAATVECGWSAEALEQADDHVELTLRRVREPQIGVLEPTAETRTVRARYVVGADGANSFVRTAAGIGFEDQGFAESWLVVDLRPDDVEALSYLPAPCQWCDPARPHMHTVNGRAQRRFEFMLLPGSGRRTSPTRRASGRCWRHGSRRTTEPSCGTRCTSSARGWPTPCAPVARCSPATPRTRCRRSWGRDCALACATRRPPPGGWTWCSGA